VGENHAARHVLGLGMAAGLGLLRDSILDSHFQQRGRLGRLLGAVTHNPQNLGIGIDEDTAIVVDDERRLEVVGCGAVTIVDASAVRTSGLSEGRADGVLSVFGLKVHVLAAGDCFDLETREPKARATPAAASAATAATAESA
jgi:cyanophycinase